MKYFIINQHSDGCKTLMLTTCGCGYHDFFLSFGGNFHSNSKYELTVD